MGERSLHIHLQKGGNSKNQSHNIDAQQGCHWLNITAKQGGIIPMAIKLFENVYNEPETYRKRQDEFSQMEMYFCTWEE